MNLPLPPRSPAITALSSAWRRLLRWISFETPIGIVPRLTIAFAAVAILAVVANDVSEHGGTLIRTIERGYAEAPPDGGHVEADALPASLELLQRTALARGFVEGRGEPETGIVDQHVERFTLQSCLDRPALVVVGEVGYQHLAVDVVPLGQCVSKVLQSHLVARHQDEVVTLPGQGAGEGVADS